MTLPRPVILDPVRVLILPRLERVKATASGWMARCPAHEDRTASLSVGVGKQGQALVHCFAGCHPVDVLAAIGLELRDLYPQQSQDASPMARLERREAWQAANVGAAAAVLAHEAAVVAIAAQEVAQGEVLFAEDRDRLQVAVTRIDDALYALEGLT